MREEKAFSVVPPWRPNHVTICLLRHSGESLQNGQLELRRRNWHFARETHKDTAVPVWACQAGFWKSTGTSCQLRSKTPCGIPWGLRNRTHWSARPHKWAWCGAARKSARLNCINLYNSNEQTTPGITTHELPRNRPAGGRLRIVTVRGNTVGRHS